MGACESVDVRFDRVLVIIGGLLCFAAMCLPLTRGWTPIRDDGGAWCWLWMLIPAMVLGGDGKRAKAFYIAIRFVLTAGSLIAMGGLVLLALAFEPAVLILLPVPLLVLIIGAWGAGGIARLVVVIAIGTLLISLFLLDQPGIGVAALVLGALLMLGGGMLWSTTVREQEDPLPVARVVE